MTLERISREYINSCTFVLQICGKLRHKSMNMFLDKLDWTGPVKPAESSAAAVIKEKDDECEAVLGFDNTSGLNNDGACRSCDTQEAGEKSVVAAPKIITELETLCKSINA